VRIIASSFLLLLLLVQFAHAQSRTHKVSCPDTVSKETCDLFNEAVEDHDENIYKASNREHVIVCFRPNSNLFLLLSYDSPHENLWRKKRGGGVEQSGNVDLLRFINGNPNFGGESLFAVGQWFSSSRRDHDARFQGETLPPPGTVGRSDVDYEKGNVVIGPSQIDIRKSYFGDRSEQPRLLKTEYDFSLTTSTNEFVETTRPPGATPISGTGRCVTYK